MEKMRANRNQHKNQIPILTASRPAIRTSLVLVIAGIFLVCVGIPAVPTSSQEVDTKPSWQARPQTPRPPFPYRQEEVTYENPVDEITITGTLTIPSGSGPFPAALLITGSGPQDRDHTLSGHKPFWVIADSLTRRGIAVLRVDDRGVGGTSPGPAEASSAELAGDVVAGVEFLGRHKAILRGAIGLVGHSEGGLIAPLAATRTKDVAFLVLLAAPGLRGDKFLMTQSAMIMRFMEMSEEKIASTHDMLTRLFALALDGNLSDEEFRRRGREVYASDPSISQERVETQLDTLSSKWYKYFLSYDPATSFEKIGCPVLALNGSLDLHVPVKENLAAIRAALEAGGNEDVTVREMADLNHLFQTCETGATSEYGKIEESFSPKVLDIMVKWILERAAEGRGN